MNSPSIVHGTLTDGRPFTIAAHHDAAAIRIGNTVAAIPAGWMHPDTALALSDALDAVHAAWFEQQPTCEQVEAAGGDQ